MLYACLYTLFVRQTCNLSYTVCVLINVIMHAQFDVRLFCCNLCHACLLLSFCSFCFLSDCFIAAFSKIFPDLYHHLITLHSCQNVGLKSTLLASYSHSLGKERPCWSVKRLVDSFKCPTVQFPFHLLLCDLLKKTP